MEAGRSVCALLHQGLLYGCGKQLGFIAMLSTRLNEALRCLGCRKPGGGEVSTSSCMQMQAIVGL
jgi:hypothetical protein